MDNNLNLNNHDKIFLDENEIYNIKTKHNHAREYQLSDSIASELNTYLSFDPFGTFNDLYTPSYDTNSKDLKEKPNIAVGTPGVRSIFNKSGAVVIGSPSGSMSIDISKGDPRNTSEWRISNNVPLMDSQQARQRIRLNSGCSIKELVQASQAGILGRETYSYSDFMYCKHLGKISNNHLITLRRFPLPVDDYISSVGEISRALPDIKSQNSESIGCMVTWLGTPGNEINNILSYSVSMPFKEQTAQFQENQTDADAGGGILNGIAATFDTTYRQQYMNGEAGGTVNKYMSKYFKVPAGDPPYSSKEINSFRDNNKIYGPVDAIKSTYMRSDEGIKFDQDITIVFDYELRSYNGINGRQAMLDLLANILNVVYTTGTFWGGGFFGGGAHQNNIFTNLNTFKRHGNASEFINAFTKDVTTGVSKVSGLMDKINNPKDAISMIWNSMKNFGAMLAGGMLNKLGRPQKHMYHSLLSPAPIGFWHLTIGNPHHPIMSLGNMILKSTKIEHYGPLGIDDFPTGLKVTCELTRGKPRDIRDIEKIYMHGNDRIYSSMGPKVFDMYKNAKEYKSNNKGSNNMDIPTASSAIGSEKINSSLSGNKVTNIDKVLKETNISIESLKGIGNKLQKYFGHKDAYSIYIAAAEQENGSQKSKSATASGDSGQKGTGGFR